MKKTLFLFANCQLPIANFILLIAFFVFPILTQAQQLLSKRGEPIQPKKGDWGVMVDAKPFFQLAGNLFNNTSGNSFAGYNFPAGYQNTLVLKKYKSDNRALRIKFRAGITTNEFDTTVVFLGGPNPLPTVSDNRTVSEKNFTIGFGTQKSRGKGRLTGYIGKELLISYSTLDTTYKYGGGPLTQYNWIHSITFGQERGVTEISRGSKLGLNLHIVFGFEYFFAPKMSVSGEFSWGLGYEKTGEGKITKEQWDFQSNKIKPVTTKIPGSHSFGIDNANNAGSINFAVYF